MANKAQAIPKGYHTVTPSIVVAGAAKAIDFYKKALGAAEVMRFPGPDGKIMHAEIRVGDSVIMLADEMPGKRAVDAGAKPIMPLADQFWGDRTGCLEDPFGHHWWLAQHIQDLTPEELRKNSDAFFSQMQPAS